MLQAIENVFVKYSEPTQSCLFALHNIALNYDEEMKEDIKYGMPLISYKGKPFCYIWADKKTKYPYLLIVRGNMINHPDLETGDRKKMKILPINPNEDIPIEKVTGVFDLAVKHYK